MPLSAVVGRQRLFDSLDREPFLHTLTFSGHPLSCAAGLAACDIIEHLAARIAELGLAMEAGLTELVSAWPGVFTGFRGRGLLWGLVCASKATAGNLITELSAEGLIVSPWPSTPDVIHLLPRAILSDDDLAAAFGALHRAAESTRTWLRAA